MNALRTILARNGFGAAAYNLKPRDLPNIEHLIHAWSDYPQNMDRYPVQLTEKRRLIR